MEDSYDMHASSISDINPELSTIMDESCNGDRIFRYKLSQIQRQILQQDITSMKEKTEEMRGKDAKIRQKFLELQQKRRLLAIDIDGVPASLLSSASKSKYTEEQETSPLAKKLPPTPPKSRGLQKRRDIAQDESFLDLPLGGLAIESKSVPNSSTHVATAREAARPPVPPPRRQRRERRSVGRAEPYRTPEKGIRSPRQPSQPMSSALSPRRYASIRTPTALRRVTSTPAQELSQLACQLQSAKKTRAPGTPVLRYKRHLATPEVQTDKMQFSQQVIAKPPKGPTLIKTHKSTGSLTLWSGLGNTRSKSSTSSDTSTSFNASNCSDVNKSTRSLKLWSGLGRRRSKSSTSADAGVSCNLSNGVNMSLASSGSSSFNKSQEATKWSMFDASYHNQKENKYNKAKREAESKPKRGMRKSKSGNKIVPVVIV